MLTGGKGREGVQTTVGICSICSLRTVMFTSTCIILFRLGAPFFAVTQNRPPSMPDFQYITSIFLIYPGLGRSSLLGRWLALWLVFIVFSGTIF